MVKHSEATDYMCDDCGEECQSKDKLRELGQRMHNAQCTMHNARKRGLLLLWHVSQGTKRGKERALELLT